MATKITVIPHGVEDLTSLTTAAARAHIQVDPDQHVVLFMGYLAGYKGVDLLIEGFAAYAKADPQALLIIGAGKHPKFVKDSGYLAEYTSMQTKAERLIPAGQHRWVGFIAEDDIAAYYSASDVVVFPYTISMSSSGPMSFAMGFTKPFLASDAFASVLPSDVLFERTPAALAQKLTYFFAHHREFSAFSAGFKQERLWSKVGAQTMALYEGLQA